GVEPVRRRGFTLVGLALTLLVLPFLPASPPRVAAASASDTWTALPTAGAPSPRFAHSAIWTGNEMIVWGGENIANGTVIGFLSDGKRYNPGTNTWSSLSAAGAPSPRDFHSATWTGTEMIIWGGYNGPGVLGDGGRYNPATDTWSPLSTFGAP